MLVFDKDDFVTDDHIAYPGYEYLVACDFRPGDLVCFWCVMGELDPTSDHYAGHA